MFEDIGLIFYFVGDENVAYRKMFCCAYKKTSLNLFAILHSMIRCGYKRLMSFASTLMFILCVQMWRNQKFAQ
ncbi:unnamed protein product [Rotaria socialis]